MRSSYTFLNTLIWTNNMIIKSITRSFIILNTLILVSKLKIVGACIALVVKSLTHIRWHTTTEPFHYGSTLWWITPSFFCTSYMNDAQYLKEFLVVFEGCVASSILLQSKSYPQWIRAITNKLILFRSGDRGTMLVKM